LSLRGSRGFFVQTAGREHAAPIGVVTVHTTRKTGGSMGDRSRLWLTWAFTAVICAILVASAYVDTHGEGALFVRIENLVAQLL
jgi:hypothetical protein